MSDIDRFSLALIASLLRRYNDCAAVATPDSILLAVLNAVHDARGEMVAARSEGGSHE